MNRDRVRGRGRGRNTYSTSRGRFSPVSSSQHPSPCETYGSSDVPTEDMDVSSQFRNRHSWPTSRGNSKNLDHTPSSTHPHQPGHSFTSGIRNSQLTPRSSRSNYPKSVKDQKWVPVEIAKETNTSLVNSESTPGKSDMPNQNGFDIEPSNKEVQLTQTPHEKAGSSSTGKPENSGCKNLPSRSTRSDPGNKHPIAANRQGGEPGNSGSYEFPSLSPQSDPGYIHQNVARRQWEKPIDMVAEISKVSLDENVGSVGKSENSDSSSLDQSFDICPEKPGNPYRLKPPSLVRNREKRNEMKRSIEGTDIRILRPGMILLKSYLSISDQFNLIKVCRKLGLGSGGFYQPRYRDGAEIHLKMMCLGMNWDPNTGNYGNLRPTDGSQPPDIPNEFQKLVKAAIEESHNYLQKQKSTSKNVEATLPSMSPNICIVNFYSKSGRLGLHQDKDESPESIDKGLPVVSFSVGDSAEFLYGDDRDPEKAEKVVLASGDVLLFGGKSRRVFHGVTNILADTAPKTLLEATNFRTPGRLNLTFRQF